MRDQETKPLDRAVFWIEYVIRHKGAGHLKSSMPELNFAQAHSLDVIGFILLVSLISGLVFIASVSRCLTCMLKKFSSRNTEDSREERLLKKRV
jgi:glucuronosyltransferase